MKKRKKKYALKKRKHGHGRRWVKCVVHPTQQRTVQREPSSRAAGYGERLGSDWGYGGEQGPRGRVRNPVDTGDW